MARRLIKHRVVVIGLMVVGLTAAFIGGAYGTHIFDDVPSGAFYHSDVTWLANRGVTSGCGGNNYCPNDPVTRGSMATFLHKFATRTRIGHQSCDGYGFNPNDSDTNYFVGTSGLTANGPVACSVHIPDGATVTQLYLKATDFDAANNVVCTLYRRPFASVDAFGPLGAVVTTGSGGVQEDYETTISTPGINNSQYTYFWFCENTPGATASTAIYGVTVTYTYPGIPAP